MKNALVVLASVSAIGFASIAMGVGATTSHFTIALKNSDQASTAKLIVVDSGFDTQRHANSVVTRVFHIGQHAELLKNDERWMKYTILNRVNYTAHLNLRVPGVGSCIVTVMGKMPLSANTAQVTTGPGAENNDKLCSKLWLIPTIDFQASKYTLNINYKG